MTSFLTRARSLFSRTEAIAEPVEALQPAPPPAPEEERLQILVGRQKAITRGRGSLTGSEGLVRDAV